MKIPLPHNDGGSDFSDQIGALWKHPQGIPENVPLYVA